MDSSIAGTVSGVKKRQEKVNSTQGKADSIAWIENKVLAVLELSGYKLPAPKRDMARIWFEMLKDVIVVYGFESIKTAVEEFIKADSGQYHQCPTVGQIIDLAKKQKDDPMIKYSNALKEDALDKEEEEIRKSSQKKWDKEKAKVQDMSLEERKKYMTEKYGEDAEFFAKEILEIDMEG